MKSILITATALVITIILAYTILPMITGLSGGVLGLYVQTLTMFLILVSALAVFGIAMIHMREEEWTWQLIHELIFYRLDESISKDKALGRSIEELANTARFNIARELGMARELKPRRFSLPRLSIPGLTLMRRRRSEEDIEWV